MTQKVPVNEGTKTANIENGCNRKEAICREERERESLRTAFPRADSDTMPETDSDYTSEDSSRSLVQNNSEKVRFSIFIGISPLLSSFRNLILSLNLIKSSI